MGIWFAIYSIFLPNTLWQRECTRKLSVGGARDPQKLTTYLGAHSLLRSLNGIPTHSTHVDWASSQLERWMRSMPGGYPGEWYPNLLLFQIETGKFKLQTGKKYAFHVKCSVVYFLDQWFRKPNSLEDLIDPMFCKVCKSMEMAHAGTRHCTAI